MQIAVGNIIAGKYRLEAPVGQGGMGTVWRAKHLKLQSEVAVKFMDPSIAASAVARDRFEREARASAQIDYLHIVHVHDYGIEGETPYIVMELLRGESLEDRLKQKLRLPIGELVPIVNQVCKGLRKAHDAGFVHRDLKPGNIFLVKNDDDEEIVKLLDFGIAKETSAAAGSRTRTGEFMGSPHYMSPEQIHDSSSIDLRSDLWSLGVILFRAVTGTLPFPGDTVGAVIGKVLSGAVPMPSSYIRGLPQGLDAFIQRALARERAARFSSAREMAEAFATVAGAPPDAGRRGSSAPWIQRDALLSASQVPPPQEQRLSAPTPIPGQRVSDPGGHSPSNPPAFPAPRESSAPPQAPFARGGQTIKMKPFQGPAPDPRPPKDLPPAHRYTGTQPVSDGTQLIAGTLTASPSAREALRQTGEGGEGRGLRERIRDPLTVKVAVASGCAVALLVTLIVVLTGSNKATEDGSAAASPPSARASAESSPKEAPRASDTATEEAKAVPSEPRATMTAVTDSGPQKPGPVAPRPPQTRPDSPKVPPDKGFLTIRAVGGICSKVTIDGVSYGGTPATALLSPGMKQVYCRTPTGSTKGRPVTVKAGESIEYSFLLP